MESIILSGKKELDVYINPQRQNLLRCMRIAGVPLTPKAIADRMGISASSAQHHIRKLAEIGVVELSHTGRVHGITAKYYRVSPRPVQIGANGKDGLWDERLALLQSIHARVFAGFSEYLERETPGDGGPRGDMLSGVVRLGREEARELHAVIRAFLEAREKEGGEGEPWEYSLVAYPAADGHE